MTRIRATLGIATLLWLAGTATTRSSGTDPFAFVALAVGLEETERTRLDTGDTLIKVLPAANPELSVFGATRIDIDADRLVAWMRRVQDLYASAYMPVVHRFSSSPRIEDLAKLALDDQDLDDIARCRPGDCGVKLSAGEIDLLQHAIRAAGREWKPAAQLAFRRVVLARAQQFLSSGYGGSAAYDDHRPSVRPETEFLALMPSLSRLPCPEIPGNDEVESFLYWSKDKLGRKSTINVTHLTVMRSADPHLPEAFVIARQVFASHYVTGSFAITALTRATPTAPRYLFYMHRSRLDVLDGRLAGVVRHVIERRIKAEAPASLQALRRRLEGSVPPGGH